MTERSPISRRPRRCRPDPWLVGPTGYLPRDPSEYKCLGVGPVIGCNCLTCEACGQTVEIEPDPLPKSRRYRCRCHDVEVDSDVLVNQVVPFTRNPAYSRELGWSDWNCQGHPPDSFPFVMDGFEIGDKTDFFRLVREVFLGALPETAPEIRWINKIERKYRKRAEHLAPVYWVLRLLDRVKETWAEERIGDAIFRCLTESTSRDPVALMLRARALACYPVNAGDEWSPPPSADRLGEILRGDLKGFPEVLDPIRREGTLRENLERAWDWYHRLITGHDDD